MSAGKRLLTAIAGGALGFIGFALVVWPDQPTLMGGLIVMAVGAALILLAVVGDR